MSKRIYRNIVFPLSFKVTGRKVHTYYKHLITSEKLSEEEIQKAAFKKLRSLIVYSHQYVPFYRNKWKEINFNPKMDFNSFSDMSKIPPLTKEDIRMNLEELISVEISQKNLVKNFTGGSTGKPLIFYQTKNSKDWGAANIYHNYRMCNWELGDKYAFLWGADRDSPRNSMKDRLLMKIRRYYWFNSFRLTNEKLTKIVKKIKEFNPKLVIGYSSSLYELAHFIHSTDDEIKIPSVESSAEKLHPFQRNKMEEILNCEVFDRYGCREVGNIAHECSQHHLLHISELINYVEILDEQVNLPILEETGQITVTNLHNYGMPFIRYQNEDIGKLSETLCNCGLNTRLLKAVIGRSSDNIITTKGDIIHGEFFTHLFYDKPQIRQFQLVQNSLTEIVIKLVKDERYLNSNYDLIIKNLMKIMQEWIQDDNITIKFKFVKEILSSKNGKFRFTVSNVSKDHINNFK